MPFSEDAFCAMVVLKVRQARLVLKCCFSVSLPWFVLEVWREICLEEGWG